ncbi:MAG: hypothetical protein JWQ97_2738 [Phenylobacterium sp.]|nr:hypothetical protein [Phenylobacterium sp.]
MRSLLCVTLAAGLSTFVLMGCSGKPAATATSSPATSALTPIPPIQGTVVAFSGKQLTVKDAHGATKSFTLADDARFLRLNKIDPSAIKAGSFVATANVSQPDGTGRSTEFRVFAPALRGLGEGNGPMAGEAPGTMMTNGTVSAEVVSTPRGREMDITYGGAGGKGVRHVVIPSNVTIREMSVADRAEIKPGVAVQVRAGQAAGGALVARAVLVGETAQPPAT